MQLDETPEFRGELEQFKASRLRAMLQRIAARGVKPDPAEVERLYRDAVREWKLASVLLEKEEDAKAFEAALKARRELRRAREEVRRREEGEGRREGAVRVAQAHAPRGPGGRPGREARRPGRAGARSRPGWVMLRVDGIRHPGERRGGARRRPARSLARHGARGGPRLLPVAREEARGRRPSRCSRSSTSRRTARRASRSSWPISGRSPRSPARSRSPSATSRATSR